MSGLTRLDAVVRAVQLRVDELSGELGPGESAALRKALDIARNGEAPAEREAAARQLLDIAESRPGARQMLRAELLRLRNEPESSRPLADAALAALSPPPDTLAGPAAQPPPGWLAPALADALRLEPLHRDEERTVVLPPGGLGGGTSRKVANFHIVPNSLVNAGMGGLMAAVSGPNPLTIAFAVWSVVHLLYGSVKRTLSEDEATVLWGLMVALGTEDEVDTGRTLTVINEERLRSGLQPLLEARARDLLDDLAHSRVIRYEGENRERVGLLEHIVMASEQAQGWTIADRFLE